MADRSYLFSVEIFGGGVWFVWMSSDSLDTCVSVARMLLLSNSDAVVVDNLTGDCVDF